MDIFAPDYMSQGPFCGGSAQGDCPCVRTCFDGEDDLNFLLRPCVRLLYYHACTYCCYISSVGTCEVKDAYMTVATTGTDSTLQVHRAHCLVNLGFGAMNYVSHMEGIRYNPAGWEAYAERLEFYFAANGHSGIVRMKCLARSYVWWPKVDQEVEALLRSCKKDPQKECGVVDAFSKWLEVRIVPSTSSRAAIEVLRELFATNGLLDCMVG
ncbi:LOW QUALITY PROTEIN: hypothetical protein M514_14770 [Trichuris suis]|uniref:RNA-directed DNA polymerase n=1 Tax=Trichuris suis TaxID=68888 RepID=A0A085NTS0_9BILA|nr:LOW QUALITY PROTEIN: hypothetical protein M514_14770 [Trichuris suis]